MGFEDIMEALKRGEYASLYFFDGEETYYMDLMTDYIAEHALGEAERGFNQTVLYAQDCNPAELSSHVKQYPMMAERRVVIVKEAQNWSRKLDSLLPLAEKPVPTTTLVINYRGKKLNGTTKLAKRIKKNAVYHTGAKLYDNKIGPWISDYCRRAKLDIAPRATVLLAESIGANLGELTKALDRLKLVLGEGSHITPGDVQKHVGISKDFNVFELQKALGNRDAARALYIANYFANNEKEHHIVPTTGALYRYFAKLITLRAGTKGADNKTLASILGVHPYFVAEYQQAARNYSPGNLLDVMDILHDIDLKSKGVNASSAGHAPLMREMVARILRT